MSSQGRADWSRRGLLRAGALGSAALAWPRVAAAQGDLLAQLKSAGTVRIGIANQPPYSALNPDGTVTGFVPTLVQRIMATLGIPKVEGAVASYGELVPGLQAGRWHMIGAAFRLNKERCQQLLFTDPVTFDGGALAYVAGQIPNPPKSLAEAGKAGLKAGILQGSYLIKLGEDLGIVRDNVLQFPNNPALIDGLLTGRVQIIVSTGASLKELQKARGGKFEVVYPIPDDPPVGSGPAFRTQDRTLHAAFQEQLRALRKSGELDKLATQFGFDPPPPELTDITGEQACARVS